MKLISLDLENIKSYKKEHIDFKEGINCILGLNGSGKSTIIESIGFALFNYSSKSTSELLRYNETKGYIIIEFEGTDDKVYIIKRTIKPASSTIQIIDKESKQVLYDTVSDVYSFVQKNLNIPKEKSLSKLFEEIIAVPQGTFVSAFLETPKKRKDNFDKLFDLDIYKDLANSMKTLNDTIEKEHLYPLVNNKERLSGELHNYDDNVRELEDLDIYIKENTTTLMQINEEKAKKESIKKELDNYKQELEKSNKQFNDYKQKIDLTKTQLNNVNEQVKESEIAHNALLTNQYGYNTYLSASNKIKELENELEEYNLLNSKYQSNLKEIDINNVKIDSLNEQIKEKKKELGIQKQNEIDANKDISNYYKIETELAPRLKELREHLEEETKKESQRDHAYKSSIEKLNNYQNSLMAYVKVDENDIQNQINEINNQLKTISEYKKVINEKNILISQEQKENEIFLANKEYMSGGICPILHSKCLNVNNSSFTDEINKKIEENNNLIYKLNEEKNKMIPLVNEEEDLQRKLPALEISKHNAQNNKERFDAIIKEIKTDYAIDIDDNNYLDTLSILIFDLEKKEREYENIYLTELNDEIININSKIASAKSHRSISEKNLELYNNNISRYTDDINNNNLEIIKLNNQNLKLEDENKSLVLKLKIYENAEIEIKEQKQLIAKFEEAYNTYLVNKKHSDELEELRAKQNDLSNEIIALNEQISIISNNIDILSSKFNDSDYQEIIKSINGIELKEASIKAEMEVKQDNYNKIKTIIEILNEKRKELENISKQIDMFNGLINKVKIYREVFTNMPGYLSEQIRNYISITASILYQKISSENVRIEMTEDYEVQLIDLADNRKVKSIKQLSGGEQMSVAIAVRLAMLKQITNLDIYFLDEPTINLDYDRRTHVGEVVKDISRELSQLFVISHDDTFDNITDNVIKLSKVNNESILNES